MEGGPLSVSMTSSSCEFGSATWPKVTTRTCGAAFGKSCSHHWARLRRNLPVGLRVVLSWDADDTDIDLWVVDPNKELAYFAHPRTFQGGLMSRDFRAGYGPEEFVLRRPKPGRYEVRVDFYGHRQQILAPHTTLLVRLYTNFGEPGQREEQIVLRLEARGDKLLVGSFDVPAAP